MRSFNRRSFLLGSTGIIGAALAEIAGTRDYQGGVPWKQGKALPPDRYNPTQRFLNGQLAYALLVITGFAIARLLTGKLDQERRVSFDNASFLIDVYRKPTLAGTLLFLLFGPLIWAAHFMLSYGSHTLMCRLGTPETQRRCSSSSRLPPPWRSCYSS